MTYAIDSLPRIRVRVRPFRLLSVLLAFVVFFLLFGILSTPTYERELAEAREAYLAASSENTRLQGELREASRIRAEEAAARNEYGYAYYGETVYQPVFTDSLGNPVTP